MKKKRVHEISSIKAAEIKKIVIIENVKMA